jgi:DNA-directed RNA polymerase subunit RPC12/RpoP
MMRENQRRKIELNRLKEKITKLLKGRYGIDDLGKTIFLGSIILYIVGVLLQKSILALAAMIGLMIVFIRAISGEHWERSEENRKYLSFIKLWKLRYENRKTARIYCCERCGKYIRVPKGKGKIQITCPGCGHRMIRNT